MFYEMAQWLGGIGLIFLGLDQLTLHSGRLVTPLLSRVCDRFAHRTGLFVGAGLLAGISLQGRRGLQYLKKRRLGGYISYTKALFLTAGLAVGLLIPALCMVWAPDYLRFPILAVGLLMSVALPGRTAPSIGKALLGLGCAWMGVVACQSMPDFTGLALPMVLLLALLLTLLLRLPCPIWLTLCAVLPTQHTAIWFVWAAAAVLAGWILSVLRMMYRTPPLLNPPATLLEYDNIAYPERALQAALQELKRMAMGLAHIGSQTLPALMQGELKSCTIAQRMEWVLDEFKPATLHYLTLLSQRVLMERQALLVLHLSSCVSDLERVGDHVYALAVEMTKHRSHKKVYTEKAHALTQSGLDLIETVAESITGRQRQTTEAAKAVLQAREECLNHLAAFREELQDDMQTKAISPKTAVRRRSLMSHLERIIRHIRAIAVAETQPDFWIDPDHIHERTGKSDARSTVEDIETKPFMEQLREDAEEEPPV